MYRQARVFRPVCHNPTSERCARGSLGSEFAHHPHSLRVPYSFLEEVHTGGIVVTHLLCDSGLLSRRDSRTAADHAPKTTCGDFIFLFERQGRRRSNARAKMMWSSDDQYSPPVLVPVNIGDSYWSGEFAAPHSPVQVEPSCCARTASIGSLSSGGELDKILKERIMEDEKQRRDAQERGRTVGKKRAVFGAVRRLLSRSRSASKETAQSGRGRSVSLDYTGGAAVSTPTAADHSSTATTTYKSEPAPAPRRLFSHRSKSKAASTASGREGCADRPRSERLGREENFHLAMDNKLVHVAFAAFCKKTFAAENIEFVRQVCLGCVSTNFRPS